MDVLLSQAFVYAGIPLSISPEQCPGAHVPAILGRYTRLVQGKPHVDNLRFERMAIPCSFGAHRLCRASKAGSVPAVSSKRNGVRIHSCTYEEEKRGTEGVTTQKASWSEQRSIANHSRSPSSTLATLSFFRKHCSKRKGAGVAQTVELSTDGAKNTAGVFTNAAAWWPGAVRYAAGKARTQCRRTMGSYSATFVDRGGYLVVRSSQPDEPPGLSGAAHFANEECHCTRSSSSSPGTPA
jgi:hypothetical protein